MRKELTQTAGDVLQSPKVAAAVSTGTISIGLGEKFQLIPWGDVAAAIGALLSLVMIAVQLGRFYLYKRRDDLEYKVLKRQEAERQAKLKARQSSGEPCRRDGE